MSNLKTSSESLAINQQVDSIWSKYDEDNSGTVEIFEFRLFMRELLMGSVDQGQETSNNVIDQIFKKVDSDNSGSIDREEMKVYIKSLMKPPEEKKKRVKKYRPPKVK